MKVFVRLLLIAVASFALFGCASTTPKDGAGVEDRSGAGAPGADTSGAGQGNVSGDPMNDPASPLYKRVIYFDLNSDTVKEEDRSTVSAHAKHLADNPDEVVTLEGHADERGSSEYNLALGERRANAVRQLLLAEGATAKQIQTVSYGEEKPADTGHDESAWDLNRRVELVYTNRGQQGQ